MMVLVVMETLGYNFISGVIFETIPTKIDVEMIINAIREQSAIHDVIVSFSLNVSKFALFSSFRSLR